MKKTRLIFLASLFLCGTAMAQQHITLSGYSGQSQISASGSVTLTDGFHIPYGNNVRIFTGASFQLCNPLVSLPSASQNYILSRVFKVAGVSSGNINGPRSVCEESQTVQYIDGLGRPLQTVTVQGSPSFADIVQPVAYDALGREAIKYQPYTIAGNSGAYRPNAIAEQLGFYTGQSGTSSIKQTAQPFSQTVFEASPLNRVLEQGAPGAPWQPYNASIASSGHTIKPAYAVNDGTDAVKLWVMNASGASSMANYQAGTLYKIVSRDENWTSGKAGTTEEFKDLEGRIVLKKVWETESVAFSTQYLFDDLGNLRYVLPPAVTATSFTEADAIFKNYIYGYHYDGRKRVIEKKIPGKGWEHLVYNKLDQVVLTQDSNQRVQNQWLFTKYDALGRTVVTGLYADGSSRSAIQASVDTHTVLWESRDNGNVNATGIGYTSVAIPTGSITAWHTIAYYDDYDFYSNSFGGATGTQVSGGRTKGLLTGTRTTVLGPGNMLLSVNYYDEEGKAVQTKSQNHLSGTDVTDNSYNFAGELLASTRTHTSSPSGTPTVIANRYEYDHMGRKLATMEEINGQVEVVLAKLDYNELGQLKQKNLHSTDGTSFLQSTTFAYNERGWMKDSKSDQFSMQLKYEDGIAPQFNGNIANQLWGTGSSFPNIFAYSYDKLNRLINGTTTSGISMGETLTYDVMGNITWLSRFDGNTTKTGNYNYEGSNQLKSITGGALATGAYSYDGNGNAVTDGRNGVTLSYNHLSLPVSATKGGLNLSYIYDATGAKLRKVSTTATTDYVAGIQYNNDVIDFIQTEEGIARNSTGNYSYEYNLTDHLGNVRYTFNRHPVTGLLQPLQADNYYAFGLRRTPVVTAGINKYLYNGKELQEELEQYDYGARFYDPVVGRWNAVDQMSGIYPSESPYAFAGNNPINFVDEGGLFKISAQFARMYPTLTRMLKYYLPMLKDNPQVKNAFIKTTGMGSAEFDQMVSYGSGPWIVPTRYDLQNSSNFTNPAYQSGSQYNPEYEEENLYISGEKLAALERAFKSASNAGKGNALGFQMFVTSLTIMHEAAHYGFFKKNGLKESQRVAAGGREIGAEFEGRAYQRFSYTSNGDAMDEGAMRKFYNSNSTSLGLSGMTLMRDLGDFSFNKLFLKDPRAPKPSEGSTGSGDPHINPRPPYKN